MFDELSTQSAEYQSPKIPTPPASDAISRLSQIVSEVLDIQNAQVLGSQVPGAIQFGGRLKMESSAAYDLLDQRLAPIGFHAQFSTDSKREKHYVTVIQGRFHSNPRPVWVNVLLLILTILSLMWIGTTIGGEFEAGETLTLGILLKGLPYAISLLLILGAHELGHYFAARYHRVAVTLPYFIPFPFGLFGTFGAFIQLREPARNRNQLFDIGAAGPLTGLLFAIPILWIGIATANVDRLPTSDDCPEGCTYMMEGNSLFYGVSKYVLRGEWLPSDVRDMTLNQLAFAGWTGLFITGLNLFPVGQLDGGHILYTLFGKTARVLYYPLLAVMGLLTFYNMNWLLWFFLLLMFGRIYAVPLDDITPLSPTRRLIGFAALVIFILIFTPNPIRIITV